MYKIVTIVGARPQFIKAAAVSRCFKDGINEILVHTGQHFDPGMSDVFFDELEIPKPKYTLNIHGGTHGHMTGRMLEAMDDVLIQEKPDAVLVYGDTNSTLAGALSASKLHIPVIHVEAGLRSFNKKMPEEVNRILTDNVSDLLFCPTTVAVENLKHEGIEKGVHFVGDVMYDATLFAIDKLKSIKNKNLTDGPYALLTIHREDSTKSVEAFLNVIKYVSDFAIKNSLKIVFPVHPRTKKYLEHIDDPDLFIISEPTGYFETQDLLSKASYVLTDSGGLQKEAYFHKVPCVTLRSETEWVETIECGWNRLWTEENYKSKKEIKDYGTGDASKKIKKIIEDHLNK